MSIRIAVQTDANSINEFDIFSGSRENEIINEEIWVYESGQFIAGYLTFNRSFYGKPFIQFLCIRENFRRQGIAEKLIHHIETICDESKLFISTESDNLPMLKLLDKNRYKMVGFINEIQDAAEIVFCKTLNK